MRIVDFKEKCLLKQRNERRKFLNYEKALRSCSSLKEQKDVLWEFYSNQTITRDGLISRISALENKKAFSLMEIILTYKDFYVTSIASLLTLFLDRCFSSGLNVPPQEIKAFILSFLLFIVFMLLLAWREKRKDARKELPLKEILSLELEIIKEALAQYREEIDFDVLMESVERKIYLR